jgi:chitinase
MSKKKYKNIGLILSIILIILLISIYHIPNYEHFPFSFKIQFKNISDDINPLLLKFKIGNSIWIYPKLQDNDYIINFESILAPTTQYTLKISSDDSVILGYIANKEIICNIGETTYSNNEINVKLEEDVTEFELSSSDVEDFKLNIAGYYGNSEQNTVAGGIRIADIPEEYNIIILTFLLFDISGSFKLVIQGLYADYGIRNIAGLITDINTWKDLPDRWGRKKNVFVSIGGATFQPGYNANLDITIPGESNYPSSLNLFNGFKTFMGIYGNIFTGLDIDLEGASRTVMKSKSSDIIEFISKVKTQYPNFLFSIAPEADNQALADYIPLFNSIDIIWPQFYNNGPNQIDGDTLIEGDWNAFNGDDWDWRNSCNDPKGCGIWQFQGSTYQKTAWQYVIEKFKDKFSIEKDIGLIVPANCCDKAASTYDKWDFANLKDEIDTSKIKYVATWCIEQDKFSNYSFSQTVGQLLN